MSKMKVIVTIIISILLAVFYMLMIDTNLRTMYAELVPEQPRPFWDFIPILTVNAIVSVMINGGRKNFLKTFFLCNGVSLSVMFIFFTILLYETMKDF